MKTQQVLLTMSILCGVAAQLKRRFTTSTGVTPAAGAWCPGVVQADTDPGQQIPVGVAGAILVTAGGAIAQDAEVQTDAAGKAITKAAGVSLGRALDAAAADGDVIRILR